MSLPTDHFRWTLMAALATLPQAGIAATSGSGGELRRVGSRTLVAYFSRSGNTPVVAGLLQRAFKANMFEIQPANPYPETYFAVAEQARQGAGQWLRSCVCGSRRRPRSL